MTISSETAKNTYAGDGIQTSFAFSFPILAEGHLKVEIKDVNGTLTTKVIVTDYTVNGTGNDTGRTNYSSGNIVFVTAPLSTDTVIITRDVPLTQETDYVENDTFPAETHEEALDKLTMINQQQTEELDRTVKVDPAVSGFDSTLPTPAADKYLRYNSAADKIEAVALTTGAGIENVADDPSPGLGGDLELNDFNFVDSNANEMVEFVETASAVNHIEVENQTATNAPKIRAKGDDTDIDLELTGKGTGVVDLNKLKVNSGQEVDEVSTDGTLAGNSDTALPTEQAVKTYVDGRGVSQAEQEAATATDKYVTPAQQQSHPSSAKVWISFNGTGTIAIYESFNVSSIVDNGTGDYTVNFTTSFSGADFCTLVSGEIGGGNGGFYGTSSQTTSSVRTVAYNQAGALRDVDPYTVVCFGDQ